MKTFIRLCNQVKNCEWKINDRSKCFGRRQGYFVWELELSFCLCKTNFTAACLVLLFICEHVSFVCVCLFIYFLSIQRGERENLVDFQRKQVTQASDGVSIYLYLYEIIISIQKLTHTRTYINRERERERTRRTAISFYYKSIRVYSF